MLEKLSNAIKREYLPPRPSRATGLRHFKKLYHCELRGGCWYVDRSITKITPIITPTTGNDDADSILEEILNAG